MQYSSSVLSGLQITGGVGTTSLRLQVNVGAGQVSSLAATAGTVTSLSAQGVVVLIAVM